jgi:hypothetical protein
MRGSFGRLVLTMGDDGPNEDAPRISNEMMAHGRTIERLNRELAECNAARLSGAAEQQIALLTAGIAAKDAQIAALYTSTRCG